MTNLCSYVQHCTTNCVNFSAYVCVLSAMYTVTFLYNLNVRELALRTCCHMSLYEERLTCVGVCMDVCVFVYVFAQL